MKYSVGLTDSRRGKSSKSVFKKGPFSKALSPMNLAKYKNFKKYNSRNVKKNPVLGKGKSKKKDKKEIKLKNKENTVCL